MNVFYIIPFWINIIIKMKTFVLIVFVLNVLGGDNLRKYTIL